MASALFELPSRTLVSGEKNLNLSRPILMGILNSTPDSFSEDSSFFEFDDALAQARKIIAEGNPEKISQCENSYTGNFLKEMLNKKFKKIA